MIGCIIIKNNQIIYMKLLLLIHQDLSIYFKVQLKEIKVIVLYEFQQAEAEVKAH